MPELAQSSVCTGCLACVDACSSGALTIAYDAEGFLFPSLHAASCTECGRCELVCPAGTQHLLPNHNFVTIPLGAWSLQENVRLKSASGGVFAELAQKILHDSGVVAGARMHGTDVIHAFIESTHELPYLQGSKYLQSNTVGIYRTMLNYLRKGDKVLFSGTPCQVAGALRFADLCECDTGLLYTCDLICNGVPSRLIYNRYLEGQGTAVEEVIGFRDKTVNKTNRFAMTMRLSNGEIVRSEYPDDLFIRIYDAGLVLRKSCYRCPFATLSRHTDITLGDYWGLKSWPEEQRYGVSLVMVHSQRGMDLLAETPSLKLVATSWDEALRLNPRAYEGRNMMGLFPARLFLAQALRHLSYPALAKLYANAARRKDICWYPYKLAFLLYLKLFRQIRKIRLGLILKKIPAEG